MNFYVRKKDGVKYLIVIYFKNNSFKVKSGVRFDVWFLVELMSCY